MAVALPGPTLTVLTVSCGDPRCGGFAGRARLLRRQRGALRAISFDVVLRLRELLGQTVDAVVGLLDGALCVLNLVFDLADFRHELSVRLQQRLGLRRHLAADVLHFLFARRGALELRDLILQIGQISLCSFWTSEVVTQAARATAGAIQNPREFHRITFLRARGGRGDSSPTPPRRARVERPLFAVADGADARGVDAESHQIVLGGVGAAVAEGEVVLLGAALVAVSFDQKVVLHGFFLSQVAESVRASCASAERPASS